MKYEYQIDMTTDNSLSLILRRITPGSRVLEFGPARGYMTRYLKEVLGCEVHAVELDPRMAEEAAPFCKTMVVGDLDDLTWADSFEGLSFDHLIFADVLEHLRDPWRVLECAKSFLREGGTVLASIPNIGHNAVLMDLFEGKFDYRSLGLLDDTHIRFFTRKSVCELLERAGLATVEWAATELAPHETELHQSYQKWPGHLQAALREKADGHVYQFITVSKRMQDLAPGEAAAAERLQPDAPLVLNVFWEGSDGEPAYAQTQVRTDGAEQEVELSLAAFTGGWLRVEPCYDPAYGELERLTIIEEQTGACVLDCSAENGFAGLSCPSGLAVLPSDDVFAFVSMTSLPQILLSDIPPCSRNAKLLVRLRLKLHAPIPQAIVQRTNDLFAERLALQQEIVQRTNDLQNEIRTQAAQSKVELEAKELELLRMQGDYAEVSKRLDSVLHSTSWRLTAPLRMVGDGVRTMLKKTLVNWLRSMIHKFDNSESAKQKHRSVFEFGRTLPEPLRTFVKSSYYRLLHVKNRVKYNHLEAATAEPIDVKDYKVSIIIPVYNNKDYLEACIRSAVEQTYENKEVILVDDCSPQPEVAAILEKFRGYDFVRIYKNEVNLGISGTQNVCLAKSTGDVIAFLDCDDILEPDAVETSMSYWTKQTKYSFTNRIHIDENSEEIGRLGFDHLPMIDVFEDHLDVNMYASHLKLIARDVFLKVGVFNSDYDGAQDYDMALRVAFHYPRSAFVHVPHFVYKHRIHTQQKSQTANDKQKAMSIRISDQAKMRRDIRNGRFHKFLSFILVSFGKEDQTLQLIQSIKRTVFVPHEIILFDNGSSDECVRFLREHVEGIEGVRLYYSNINHGPAGGRREALKHARKDAYYLSLDNDIEVTEGWLEELLVRAEENEQIASVTCRVSFPNQVLQFTGGYEEISGNRVQFKLYNEGKSLYDLSTLERYETAWNPVGATLFKGWFPEVEGYPNVYEDSAISYLLRRAGKILVNSPNSLVIHHHIMFDEERKNKEKDYLAFRYHPKLMLKSLSSFYQDYGMIIDDPYIYSMNKLKVNEMADEDIIKAFERLEREMERDLQTHEV